MNLKNFINTRNFVINRGIIANNEKHLYNKQPFHLVTASPWPFWAALSAFGLTTGTVFFMHNKLVGQSVAFYSLVALVSCMAIWWRDVIRESTFEGNHTKQVVQGLRLGMILFIISEVMFFVAFFWGFYHSSLVPSVDIGTVWPPKGILTFNPWSIPALNTLILLLSGGSLTWAHNAIKAKNRQDTQNGFLITILLGIIFTVFQAYEYVNAGFNMFDSVYGSVFYLATGFHGVHVLIGTVFLITCYIRHIKYQFTKNHHFGFDAGAWYWHFVDAVWIFLFLSIYWWGS